MDRELRKSGLEMATIKIYDVEDARVVSAHFGFVPSNEGQRGAFPIRQLAAHLEKIGHELDTTEYDSTPLKADPTYRVVAHLVRGEDDVLYPAYALITLSEVREITGKTGRGRPGFMDIINATVKREQWNPVGNRKNDFDVEQV